MRFTRCTYPDYPGVAGSPCWRIQGRYLDIDIDWNTRFPFGCSAGFHAGQRALQGQDAEGWAPVIRGHEPVLLSPRNGFLLDLNAPEGEPNRIYVTIGCWHLTLGLLSWHRFKMETIEVTAAGRKVIHGREVRGWPRIDGIIRYRYHQDDQGQWIRDPKPMRGHWGWLTIEKRG